jgi:hypothetical protein
MAVTGTLRTESAVNCLRASTCALHRRASRVADSARLRQRLALQQMASMHQQLSHSQRTTP